MMYRGRFLFTVLRVAPATCLPLWASFGCGAADPLPPIAEQRQAMTISLGSCAASELVAAGRSEEEVARLIGADWLVYQDLSDLVAACQHDNAKIVEFDTSCFSGEYVTGDVTAEYLAKLQRHRSDAARSQRRDGAGNSLRVVGGA